MTHGCPNRPTRRASVAALVLSTAFAAPALAVGPDTDDDGVADANDAFPCDASAAAVAFSPSENEPGLLVFEDLWPHRGDLDFNDVALSYHYRVRLDAAGRAVGLRATYHVRALGGSIPHGFGLHLPVPRSALASVTRAVAVRGAEDAWVVGPSTPLTASQADNELTVVISSNMRELFGDEIDPINARTDLDRRIGAPITVDVTFATPQQLSLGAAPFDLYVFQSAAPGHEIHRSMYPGTAAMDGSLFGQVDDRSAEGRWFTDYLGLPSVLTLPSNADYPAEGVDISALYPRIVDFALSSGQQAADFYTTPLPGAAYADARGLGAPEPTAVLRTSPEPFCFAPLTELAASTQFTSDAVALRGFAGAIAVGVTGAGSPQISVNDGPWSSAVSGVRAPATLRVRQTSSANPGVRHDADVVAGEPPAARWSITTMSVPIGQQSNPGISCRNIREAGGGTTSGVYWLRDGNGTPYQSYCDMVADGGGWTAIFSGVNGTPNAFDGFDRTASTCTNLTSRCIRRPPAGLDGTRVELAVSCGSAMVALPMTRPMWSWLSQGTRASWLRFSGARTIAGSVGVLPNSLYTGSASDNSFIFAFNNAAGGNTFASTYPQDTSWNYCNGSSNTSATVRLYYRERASVPVRNTVTAARASCRQILDAGESAGDGVYWLRQSTGAAYQAYCDMTLDGGGWTTMLAGQNGSPNVFDRFDSGSYQGVCTDPATRCLRRAPATLAASQTQIAARVGSFAVRFPMTGALHGYFTQGTQGGWQNIAAESIGSGSIVVRPNRIWLGGSNDVGLVLAVNDSPSYVFASSYPSNATWDAGNLAFDTGSPLYLMYREGDPPADPAARGTSCRDVLARGLSTGDGVYRLQQPGRSSYDAYCNMTTDGGGWTAVLSATNGTPHVFDGFDDRARPAATCTDVSTRCVRRPPPSIANTRTEVMAECGNYRVAFPMTTPIYNHWVGGASIGWTDVTGARSVGTTAASLLPDSYYGGSTADHGVIVARSRAAGGNTFLSTYPESTTWNYCHGTANTSSRVRLYYREAPIASSLNAEASAPVSCRAILDAGQSTGSGNYWIRPAGTSVAVLAYCDMTLDGGGWTTIFAGQNGSMNVFDHFDAGVHQGICTDPATRCVRRAPASVVAADTQVAIRLGDLAYRFPMTAAIRSYLVSGTQAGWQPIAAESIGAGTVTVRPTSVWTGQSGNPGFIAAALDSASYVFASSYVTNASWDYGNRAYDVSSLLRVMYRESTPPVDPTARGTSCLDVLRRGLSTGSGVYRLQQPGRSAYDAYCDMVSDGGGWTAMYAGTNGTPHVFDGFDDPTRPAAICTDPSTRCIRRPPPDLNLSRAEVAVACGNPMVAMPMTAPLYRHFVLGERVGWQSLTGARSIGSSAAAFLPDSYYGGTSTDRGFIWARSQAAGGNTFASAYPTDTSFNYCNGTSNTSARVRVFYRESPVTTALNAQASAPVSCRAILDAGQSAGNGNYWIRPTGAPAALLAYCDMTLDGGGWTTFFAGQNGSMNVFDRFETGHTGVCSDPATRCLRRVPTSLVPNSTAIAVSVGTVAVRFPLTTPLLGYFGSGTQAGWQPIAAESIGDGTILTRPTTIWTGSNDPGFVVGVQDNAALTFASSYPSNTTWDYANRVYDVSTLVRVMYREGTPPFDATAEGTSCQDIRARGLSRGNGVYRLQQAGSSAYQAYCDMTADGGGWTAVFAGTNGTPNVFDGFDGVDRPAATCTNVSTRCVRRPPTSITAGATQIAVSCGNAMVRFPLTAEVRNFLLSGTRASWVSIPGATSIGSTAVSTLPDTFYTGGSGDYSFIVARSSAAGGNTFASTYPGSSTFNYCNGSSNTSAQVRVYYR